MKLLLDQGLPRSAAATLRTKGIDTIHVGEIGYSTATDTEIIKKAIEQDRIVVTLDADFMHYWLFREPQHLRHPYSD